MDIKNILIAYFVSLSFVAWPIVGSYSGITGGWVGTVVLGFTGIVVGIFSFKELVTSQLPSLSAILILICAGIVNGIGCYIYAIKTAENFVDNSVQAGVFVAMVSVLMVINGPLLDYIFNQKTITLNQGFGLSIIVFGIIIVCK